MKSSHLIHYQLIAIASRAIAGVAGNSFVNPSGYSSTSYNYASVTQRPNNDFSNANLAFLWDQIGPVATGPITTTVTPTGAPSYATPGLFHPKVPTYDTNLTSAKLPDDFVWGLASSAYQIEGAAKDEGKGPSIWDLISHRVPAAILDNSTGDVVAQHYYLYKQDIAGLKSLGVPYFSSSVSWPRLFPFGRGPVNKAGVEHYDDVIMTLVQNGIKLVVTLFHWDTPLALFYEYGAWSDEQIVEDFFNYAKFVITRYDKYVPIWFTINEPQYCDWQYSGYPAGEYYPAYHNITGGMKARFTCGHYTLLAHARVAKWYHEEFHGNGRITLKNSGNYMEALNSSSPANIEAVQRNYDFGLGWFGGPWTDGDYPQSLKDTLGDILPKFTDADKALIKGSCDFYAIDAYTSYFASGIEGGVAACASNPSALGWPTCANTITQTSPSDFPLGPSGDPHGNFVSAPMGIRRLLNVLTKDYFPNITDIVVSEFGFAEPYEGIQDGLDTILWDLRRADYYQGYMDNILAAKVYDEVNVTGIFGWAIFDNFEWHSGKHTRFGLQYVNYTSLERVPKASMFQFLDWFKTHGGSVLPGSNTSGSRNNSTARLG